MAAMLFYIAFFFSYSPGYTNPLQNFDVESFFTGVMFGMVIFAGSGSSIFISENTRRSGKLVPIANAASVSINPEIVKDVITAMGTSLPDLWVFSEMNMDDPLPANITIPNITPVKKDSTSKFCRGFV